jgi:PAS domain S-box-containing protein
LYNKNYPNFLQPNPEEQELLVMKEGTGEAGHEMKRRGHNIPLRAEQSLVARAARSLEPVIVNDVGQNPNHLPNPLLPQTRSEAAIPLSLSRRLVGVLDVQHTAVNHFSVEEVRSLQIVASQLSVALFNAQLFDENAHRLAIIENASNLIALMSVEEQIIIYINSAGAELAGYTHVEQVLGQPLAQFYHPDEFARIKTKALAVALAKGVWRGESFIKRTDGEHVPVDQTIFVICDNQDHPQTLATIVTDITERKQAEKTLQKINEELEARVTERTETLMVRTRELEQSNAELEQFAYVASHDLQEPLRMITSYVQLLAHRYQDQLDNDANDFIGYAVDGATRMQQLINDLLAYSRVGTTVRLFEPTPCPNVIKQVIHNLEPAILESKATITYDELPVVMADKLQLEQLFQNLISNAIKFCSQARPQIHITAKQNQVNEWVFSVQDNGIGIEQIYADRIFVIFQRLHTRDKYSGTGIGLAICKKIVERHNGQIWFESQLGQGTTFYFTIPVMKGV